MQRKMFRKIYWELKKLGSSKQKDSMQKESKEMLDFTKESRKKNDNVY